MVRIYSSGGLSGQNKAMLIVGFLESPIIRPPVTSQGRLTYSAAPCCQFFMSLPLKSSCGGPTVFWADEPETAIFLSIFASNAWAALLDSSISSAFWTSRRVKRWHFLLKQ